MSLFSVLSSAATGLAADTAASSTAGQNINNANTPGYSRQRVNLSATLPEDMLGGQYLGRGVDIQSITQARDRFVEAQLPGAFANASGSQATSDSLSAITALDPSGQLGTGISNFYSSLRALAQDPANLSLRQAAVASAQATATAFNASVQQVAQARSSIDTEVQGQLSTLNQQAAQLASLNQQIRIARGTGGSPNDLLDARQQLSDQLSQLTGATPVADASGDTNLVFSNGKQLVIGSHAATVTAVADPTNSNHLALQITGTDNSSTSPLGTISGGKLGGMLEARDGAMKTAQDRLDQMAFDFAGAVNTNFSAGYGLDGVNGRPLFDTTATAQGAASSLTVDAAISGDPSKFAAASTAAGVPGDATNLQNTIDTESQGLTNGLDVTDTLSDISAQFGATAAQAAAAASVDGATSDHLVSLRDSTSGVSIDEEMVELTKSQRAYEAVTQVIKTADDMLSTLLGIK